MSAWRNTAIRRVCRDALRAPVFAEVIIEEDLVRLIVTLEVVQCCWKVIRTYVLPATRSGGDNTTVPVMAKGTTDTARYYVNVRHDRPFAETDRPAAMFQQLAVQHGLEALHANRLVNSCLSQLCQAISVIGVAVV
jgi:hypothetical protein